jgi:hypothetical protein
MIVKVQRPLYPPDAPCLIYDKSRRFVRQQHLCEYDAKKMGNDYKAYFTAKKYYRELVLLNRIPDQDW